MTYDEAIRRYGIDKPDMRLPAMVELTEMLTPELRHTLKIEQALPVLRVCYTRGGHDERYAKAGTGRRDSRLLSENAGLDFLDVARLKKNPNSCHFSSN